MLLKAVWLSEQFREPCLKSTFMVSQSSTYWVPTAMCQALFYTQWPRVTCFLSLTIYWLWGDRAEDTYVFKSTPNIYQISKEHSIQLFKEKGKMPNNWATHSQHWTNITKKHRKVYRIILLSKRNAKSKQHISKEQPAEHLKNILW